MYLEDFVILERELVEARIHHSERLEELEKARNALRDDYVPESYIDAWKAWKKERGESDEW